VLIELFSLDATTEALRANIDWNRLFRSKGQFDPEFQE